MYVNLTRKTFINLSLLLLLPPIFASFCISYKITVVITQHIKTPLSNVALLNLGNILVVNLSCFPQNGSMLPGKKPKFECRK